MSTKRASSTTPGPLDRKPTNHDIYKLSLDMEAFSLSLFSWAIPLFGLIGFALAYKLYVGIQALPAGNARMQEISDAIRDGAIAYLRKQAQYLSMFIIGAFLVIWWALQLPTAYRLPIPILLHLLLCPCPFVPHNHSTLLLYQHNI